MDIKEIVNYFGLIIGVLGIILSVYLFKKGLEKKEPRCYYRTVRNISKLSDENDPKITIFYDKEEVTRIFTTRIWVWNNGKKPINQVDIPIQSSIHLILRDNEFKPTILDYKIIKMSRSEINFSVSRSSETSLVIGFNFLDQNDGAVLEIQHTGSKETELSVEGIILGVPDGFKIIENQTKKRKLSRIIFRINLLFDTRRNPKKLFALTAFSFILVLCMLAIQYNNTMTNPSVSVTMQELREILISEIPNATDEDINNIVNKLSVRTKFVLRIFIYSILIYILILSVLLVYVIWRFYSRPYPKAIKLDNNYIIGKSEDV